MAMIAGGLGGRQSSTSPACLANEYQTNKLGRIR
jgi:hypothetical protein